MTVRLRKDGSPDLRYGRPNGFRVQGTRIDPLAPGGKREQRYDDPHHGFTITVAEADPPTDQRVRHLTTFVTGER